MEKAFHTSRDEMLFSYCMVPYSQLAQHNEQYGAKNMFMVYDDKCTQISDEGCFILHSRDTSIKKAHISNVTLSLEPLNQEFLSFHTRIQIVHGRHISQEHHIAEVKALGLRIP